MSEPAAAPAPSPGTPPAAPAPPAGAPPAAAPPVRIGLVGAGFIARWMMEAVAVVPGAQAVAVASAHPERAEAFAAALAEHGVRPWQREIVAPMLADAFAAHPDA